MSRFELDEAHVAQVEGMLVETGEVVNAEATRAANVVHAASGNLNGQAFTAAVNKQNDFGAAAARMHAEIAQIAEWLGLSRQAISAQDDLDMQNFNSINYERLA